MQVGDKVRLTKEFCEDEPEWTGCRTGWRVISVGAGKKDNIHMMRKGLKVYVSAKEIEVQA